MRPPPHFIAPTAACARPGWRRRSDGSFRLRRRGRERERACRPRCERSFEAAPEVQVLTQMLPGRLARLAGDVDRFRHQAGERLDSVLRHVLSIGARANGAAARLTAVRLRVSAYGARAAGEDGAIGSRLTGSSSKARGTGVEGMP